MLCCAPAQVPFHTGRSVTLGKQFYCLMQYSRFIRGGATILASSQHKSVLIAQTSPQQQQQRQIRDRGHQRADRLRRGAF